MLDTRKTLPGLRLAQKYAVRVGGGANQRLAFYDGILIKDNPVAAAGGVGAAMDAALALNAGVSIQIEAGTLEQLETALALRHNDCSVVSARIGKVTNELNAGDHLLLHDISALTTCSI
ncbi:hypothetical protein SBC1_80000 (plasmid) [Caballeronia sp. SBC1]|nr:hypothetical protein SBC1_80000 [Caballeronia sp. SBC1]